MATQIKYLIEDMIKPTQLGAYPSVFTVSILIKTTKIENILQNLKHQYLVNPKGFFTLMVSCKKSGKSPNKFNGCQVLHNTALFGTLPLTLNQLNFNMAPIGESLKSLIYIISLGVVCYLLLQTYRVLYNFLIYVLLFTIATCSESPRGTYCVVPVPNPNN